MMPARQLWLFKFGCWASLVSAAVHLAGHVIGLQAPANAIERQLVQLASEYHMAMPGGSERSLMDFLNGFSLMFALMLATLGSVGLIVEKRGHGDPMLMLGVARAFTVATTAVLVVSVTHFFIVPTLFIAVLVVCFFCASVQAPIEPVE